jgi:hypothetical protein
VRLQPNEDGDRQLSPALPVAVAIAITVAGGVGWGYVLGIADLSVEAGLILTVAFVGLVVSAFLLAFAARRRGRR